MVHSVPEIFQLAMVSGTGIHRQPLPQFDMGEEFWGQTTIFVLPVLSHYRY